MKIKDSEPVFPVEALEAIEETEEGDRTHEQKIASENLSRHTQVTDMDTLEELRDELMEIESLKDRHTYKLLEIVPEFESTVRSIFSKERVRLDQDDIDRILEVTTSVDTQN